MPLRYRRRFIKAIASAFVLGRAGLSSAQNHTGHNPVHTAKDASNIARSQPKLPIRVGTVAPFVTPLRIPGSAGHFAQLSGDAPLRLTAKIIRQPIFGGDPSDLWVYEANIAGQLSWNPFLRLKKGSQVSAVIEEKINNRMQCMRARLDVMFICFRGGDGNHWGQIQQQLNGLKNCLECKAAAQALGQSCQKP